MKYFLDTEFHEYKKKPLFGKPIDTIELISIGIVCEDGREYYALNKDFNLKEVWKDEWLRENVLLPIYIEHVHGDMRNHVSFSRNSIKGILKGFGKSMNEIASEIKDFCYYSYSEVQIEDTNIQFYGYYSDYDWVVFCWLFGKMIDLPKSFPMYCIDLKQTLDEKENNKTLRIDVATIPNNMTIQNYIAKYYKFKSLKEHPNYPKQTNEHNALADAKWNYKLYKFLNTI